MSLDRIRSGKPTMSLPKWVQRVLPTKDRIRHSALYRLLGHSIFANDLWHFDERAVAGGLALGLFVAFTPTIPFQMLLTTVGALYFRVNLPVGLAACWVTNPLTALPFYWMAFEIGRYTMSEVPWIAGMLKSYTIETKLSGFLLRCMHLWAGCLMMAAVAATIGHFTVRLAWGLTSRCASRLGRGDTSAADPAPPEARQDAKPAKEPKSACGTG
ncbi:MAG: DUF2062 domain-containing protein [Planctomycetes bacterium]|nr:DUF2062 domain-containing protein [Planctomycetota bacterium]